MMRLLIFLLLPALVTCFAPILSSATSSDSKLSMAPRYNEKEQKWYPTSPEEEPKAGYNLWGSLLRHGPNPFINRLFQPEQYNQGVLKFMAGDDVDRSTAQAEMDAYLRNPSDWAYNRANGYNVDYLKLDKQQIVLTLTWSAMAVPFLGRIVYCGITREGIWDFL